MEAEVWMDVVFTGRSMDSKESIPRPNFHRTVTSTRGQTRNELLLTIIALREKRIELTILSNGAIGRTRRTSKCMCCSTDGWVKMDRQGSNLIWLDWKWGHITSCHDPRRIRMLIEPGEDSRRK